MDNLIQLKDCNGQYVFVHPQEIVRAIGAGEFKLFGMDLDTILEFQTQYRAMADVAARARYPEL